MTENSQNDFQPAKGRATTVAWSQISLTVDRNACMVPRLKQSNSSRFCDSYKNRFVRPALRLVGTNVPRGIQLVDSELSRGEYSN